MMIRRAVVALILWSSAEGVTAIDDVCDDWLDAGQALWLRSIRAS
jgi:hypothetical protein